MGVSRTWYDREGDIVHKYTMSSSGRFTRERISANGRAVAELNQTLQRDKPLRDLSFGRWGLQIPENEYNRLLLKKPELSCWDKDIRTKAWKRFMASSESKPYRVHEKV